MSDIWIKTSSTATTKWRKALAVSIKRGASTWSNAKNIWIKTGASAWLKVWPFSGPYATDYPYIVSTVSGSTHLTSSNIRRTGTSLFGRFNTSDWNSNGWGTLSYTYSWKQYDDASGGAGAASISNGNFSAPSKEQVLTIGLNKKYLSFLIRGTSVSNPTYFAEEESGDSADGRIYVVQNLPAISVFPDIQVGSLGSALTVTPYIGQVLTYSNTWSSSQYESIESSRTLTKWYRKSTYPTIVNDARASGGGYYDVSGLTSIGTGLTYTVTSQDVGFYLFCNQEVFNSGSDYDFASFKWNSSSSALTAPGEGYGMKTGYSCFYKTVASGPPIGTDDTVTFSRDSQSSYNFSITNTGTWTGSPTSYRYQWYTYESTFGGNSAWFEISGATSSTFNASGIKLASIMPIVWASNAGGESNTGYSLTNTNGTRPTGNIGSISAAATQVVKYTAPIIASFSVTGAAGSVTYSYSVTGDDPSRTLAISYSGAATGSFTPGASGSTQTGLAAGTYTFVLTATNSINGNAYSTTSTVANVIVTAPLTSPVNTVAPAVTPTSGTAGATTYSSTTGTWTGNPTPTYAYQWQYNDQGSLFLNITGETSSTYSPPLNFFSTKASPIRCRVTATNSQAPSGVSATSNQVTVSPPIYVVTYDYQGATGGNTVTSVNVTQGNATTLTNPTRTNYNFGGWYTAITGGTFIGNGSGAYTPTASITLYARWVAINWTVTWDPQAGSVSPTSNTGIQGSTVTAPTPTKTNNTFLYWRDSTSSLSYLYQLNAGASWTLTSNITFYAWWSLNQYTVTYNANGGSVSPASALVNAGSSTTLPTPTRSGYTFNGWYTAASGGTSVGSGGASYTPTASITIYAQWTVVVVNYTMTWRANGGSSGDQTTGPFASGTAHTAPSPGTRTGYTFSGYYDTASLDWTIGPISAGGTYTPIANTTLQARWAAIVPSITQIVVSGNVTAGVTCAVTGTNMGSIQYTFYARDTGSSAWTQISAGTAAPSSATSASISTTGSVGTLPDQYYVDMQPFFGARLSASANQGTGTSGTLRSTSGSPKNNQSGSVTVNF
jgi:uncharacterized repeat protein (TIGR02543 family)